MNALHLESIFHAYDGQPVVNGVTIDVRPGELASLLGPSGCGKTTLLRLAAGLERIQHGNVVIGGRTVAGAEGGLHENPEHRGAGLMFQDYALFPHMTIQENILFGLNGQAPGRAAWVSQAMDRMGISRFAGAYPHTLSGGQQQRAALLRALAPAPEILLLDEPFSDLDVNRRIQVRDATLELIKESGAATLMVTHDPEEAMFMADRILVMEEGRIAQSGTPYETYFQPANAFVAALFGPVNRMSGVVRNGTVRTPLGEFEAPALADGTPAEVLIRLEGIKLTTANGQLNGSPKARLVSARLLGRFTHVRIAVADDTGQEAILQARVPGVCRSEANETVALDVDRNQAFVFPT